MKIGLVSQEFTPETAKGGIGTQTRLKAEMLSRLGHAVRVISRAPQGPRTKTRRDGYRLIRVASGGFPAATEIGDWISHSVEVAAEIARQHARDAFDLVEFPEWAAEGYVHLANTADWNRIPTVIQIHGPLALFVETMDWPEPGSTFRCLGQEMEAACLRMADAVYSSSAYSRAICARVYGLDPDRVPVLHSGIDMSRFTPALRRDGGPPRVLFVGKLVESKGVLDLAEAALTLADRGAAFSLDLIGGGESHVLDRLRAMAADRGHPGLIRFGGYVPPEDLPGRLAGADIFAAPSPVEGGPGFVYLEAMAAGLPCIACAGTGAAEAVIDGRTGRLVPPHDPAALAEVLQALLEDPPLRRRMGAAARAHVEATADCTRQVARIADFYRHVLSRADR